MLAVLGRETGGTWLQVLISIDAFVVLAGAVLTDFLGFIGLAERLAMDQCFPAFFLTRNQWRGTKHWGVLAFLVLCTSMYLALQGKVEVLANVYAVSFMGVMFLYALGDMLLKYYCGDLPRNTYASWTTLIAAMCLVFIAFLGVVFSNQTALFAFACYFCGFCSLIVVMKLRVQLLAVLISMLRHISKQTGMFVDRVEQQVRACVA